MLNTKSEQGLEIMALRKMLLLGSGFPLKVSGPGNLVVDFFYLLLLLPPEYLTR